MKFQFLPLGARFEYAGAVYVKTGPLTAASEAGGQRMIPRHADLQLLDGSQPVVPAPTHGPLDRAVVVAAFEAFCRECEGWLAEGRQADWQAARRRFLDRLADAEPTNQPPGDG